jgi:hypothetical protein
MTGLEGLLIQKFLESASLEPAKPRPPITFAEEKTRRAVVAADNFADMTRAILLCYHGTARYRSADVVERPWTRQSQYGAQRSALVRIDYSGISSAKYRMMVAVMAKDDALRAHVVDDSAVIAANPKCALVNWMKVAQPKEAPQAETRTGK